MQVEALTNVGLVRKDNEDNYLVSVDRGLFVVADGMGGHAAGQLASSLAVSVINEETNTIDSENIGMAMKNALLKANEIILNKGMQNQEYAGMGTTVTAALIKGYKLYLAHIGDSRAYLFRKKLQQLTQDHSLVNELFQKGSITLEEKQNHPQRNILTRAVGTQESPLIDEDIFELQAKDILLLCTDGLHGHLDEQDIEIILGENISLKDKLRKMLEIALERGGNDNITAILVCCE